MGILSLASNLRTSCISLLCSWDYRPASLHLGVLGPKPGLLHLPIRASLTSVGSGELVILRQVQEAACTPRAAEALTKDRAQQATHPGANPGGRDRAGRWRHPVSPGQPPVLFWALNSAVWTSITACVRGLS